MTSGAEPASLAQRLAARTGVEEAVVTAVMATHGVTAAAAPAAARSLWVARVRIIGTKTNVPGAGPFDRTFTFPKGVVMAVGPNLSGKTSLLEIITLCLRGTGRDLQADVAAWLQAVECDVELNGTALAIRLTLDQGTISTGTVHQAGSLSDLPDAVAPGRTLIDARGSEYADRIEALMLDRLDLEPIHAVDQKAGLQQHGWPSYFGALYPPAGGERVLIGETAYAGLAGRLLAVFLDLPRTAVLTRVRTAIANLKAQAERDSKRSVSPRTEQLLAVQEEALREAKAALAAMPEEPGPPIAVVAERVAQLSARLTEAESEMRELAGAYVQAKADRQEDERALNTLRENFVAARLFHGLDPSNCPRCEAPVDTDRKARENSEHVCAVCTEPLVGADDEEVHRELVEEREQALEASRAAEEAAQRAIEAVGEETSELTSDLQEADAELTAARVARETSGS